MTCFLCTKKADKKFCKTRGKEQFKEVDSRQIQGFKLFQDSADWTRKKTQGGTQGEQ
jgi:hypothetical protein